LEKRSTKAIVKRKALCGAYSRKTTVDAQSISIFDKPKESLEHGTGVQGFLALF
jgi:hypothetical protein